MSLTIVLAVTILVRPVADIGLPATPERVEAKLRLLDPRCSSDIRYLAAWWFARHANEKPTLAALTRLGQTATKDPSSDVRSKALVAAVKIAKEHKLPSPDCLVDALFDSEESIVITADFLLQQSRTASDAHVEKFLRLAKSDKVRQRDYGLSLLATLAPKHLETLKLIRAATTDPDRFLRHNAHVYLFRVTDDLNDFLPYILSDQADYSERTEPKPTASDDEKAEYASRNICTLVLATKLANWIQHRPVEMRAGLLKLLSHDNPRIRWATADLVKRQVVDWKADRSAADMAVEMGKSTPDIDPDKVRRGQEALFKNGEIRKRLAELEKQDRDAKVRVYAWLALQEFDKRDP